MQFYAQKVCLLESVIFQVKKENIPGDMKGDGFQNGGTLVVGQGRLFYSENLVISTYRFYEYYIMTTLLLFLWIVSTLTVI